MALLILNQTKFDDEIIDLDECKQSPFVCNEGEECVNEKGKFSCKGKFKLKIACLFFMLP